MADNSGSGFTFSYSGNFVNNLAQRLEQVARAEQQGKTPVITLTPVNSAGEQVGEAVPVQIGQPPSPPSSEPEVKAPAQPHRPVFRQQPAHTSDVQRAYRFGVETTAKQFQGKLEAAQSEVERYENAIREAAGAAANIAPEIPKEDQERLTQLHNLIDALDASTVAPRQVFGETCDTERHHALMCFRNAQKHSKGTPDTLPCTNVLNAFLQCANKMQTLLRLPIPKIPSSSAAAQTSESTEADRK